MSGSSALRDKNNQIFTDRHLVGHMCELCEPSLSDWTKKVFEPGCGAGNFLIEVLHRRLLQSDRDPQVALMTLSNLYGIDIDEVLVRETRRRLRDILLEFLGPKIKLDDKFFALVDKILASNIVVGDLLGDPEKIFFVEWRPLGELNFAEDKYSLAELITASPSASIPKIALRPEQKNAIEQTFNYWREHHNGGDKSKFLWNAKPRFGKTFATYQFAEKIAAERVLIISNRPAISDSWIRDFYQFVAPFTEAIFASSKGGNVEVDGISKHIYSRSELLKRSELLQKPLFFFISLQDLKGKDSDGEFKSRNQWIFKVQKPWDLLIIDESHDGVKTFKTRRMLDHIHANFILHLSGTPFRALADGEFSTAQIFNWTYLDEQLTKTNYSSKEVDNPYRSLPQLNLFTYNLTDCLPSVGKILNTNELFRTQNGCFVHEDLVLNWLDVISQDNPKTEISQSFPFSVTKRDYFRHTFWLFSHVDECRAMAKLLVAHPYFKNYQTIVVAGKDDSGPHEPKTALARVRKAIDQSPTSHTITLSCGRLTTGITVPEWTGVLMLGATTDLQKASSAQYLQAAFRAQNPWQTGNFIKTDAFVFDWSPDRAMLALRDYAINLCSKTNQSPLKAVSELICYFPLSISQSNGKVLPLSPQQILDLPAKLAAQEIVDGNFVSSDKLFHLEIIPQLSPAANRVINKIYGLKKHGFESSPQPIPDSVPTAPDENIITKKPTRSHKKRIEDDYRTKLRGFTSTIPFLLHLYGQFGQTLPQLVEAVPDKIFVDVTGISKTDFQILYQENFFHDDNCSAAIQEFLQREKQFSNYHSSHNFSTIFDCIPFQRQYVFTPLATIEHILNILELQRPNLFSSPDHTYLDLCSKSGLFSIAVVRRLFRNLRSSFSSDHACLLYILTHQIYAWSLDSATQQSTLQTLFSSQRFGKESFSNDELAEIRKHFVVYNPSSGKEVINYVKVIQKNAEFWEDDVKFDIIIGNPPYQSGRRQVYADFYRMAVDLEPELLCLIFPQGWQKVTNTNGLKQLNNVQYKRDPHLVLIDHYYENDERRIFPEIGTGGVNIVLRDNQYDNRGQIRKLEYGQEVSSMILPVETDEVDKPSELECLRGLTKDAPNMSSLGSARRPYGFSAEPLRQPWRYRLKLQDKRLRKNDVRLFGLFASGERGYKYIPREGLPKTSQNLDHYKLFVPKAWGNMSLNIGLGGSYSNICLARPGDACAETFIEFGPLANQENAYKMAKYFLTKFFRACLFLAKTSQNTARDKYRYVPVPDFSQTFWQKKIAQIDEALFEQFQIPASSRDFIRKNFQTRDEHNIEIL